MINLAVIKLKDIINFIRNTFIGIIILVILIKACGNIKKGNYVKINELKEKSFFDYSKIIDKTLIISNYLKKEDNTVNKSGIKKILGAEFAILEMEEELMEKENQEEILEIKENINTLEKIETENINEEESFVNENNLEDIKKTENVEIKLPTTVIMENNKKDTYTDIYKNIKVKNESKYQLTEELLTPNFNLANLEDIIIYHTHTCESYTPTQENNYEASGNFRTTDFGYNVARVGTELEGYLKNNFNVIHNKTYHDYPAYSGSYTRSLSTIKSIVSENYSRISN